MKNVCAVLVTYNRLELLKESISAILNQSYKVHQLIIVDNQSTDGTSDYLKQTADARIKVYTPSKNVGGAGGFQIGINQALQDGENDFVWIMDDDTIPQKDCLDRLLNPIVSGSVESTGFMCSNVRWTDDSAAVMNIPYTTSFWNELAQQGLIQVKAASFVSLLVSTQIIREVGLPIKEFFVWGDDYEFTRRISKKYKSYCVCNSLVTHKMGVNHGVDIVTDTIGRIPRYFYSFRNALYTERHHDGVKGLTIQILREFYSVHKVLHHSKDHKWLRIRYIFKGMFAGLAFNPQIQFPKERL